MDNGKERAKKSKVSQKSAYCECSNVIKKLIGNVWKCGKNLKWIKKFFLSKIYFLFEVYYTPTILTFLIILLIAIPLTLLLRSNITSNDKFSDIIIGFLTILFTMAIPFAIAKYNDLSDNDKPFNCLDQQIFLTYEINPVYFVFWLVVIFIPLLYFNSIRNDIAKTLISLMSIGGVFILTFRLIGIYNWSKNAKIEKRKKYLNNAGFDKEFIEAWKSIWIAKGIDENEEKEYLCIFMRRIIESLSCKEKLDITKKLLKDFKENLSKRNPKNMEFIRDILMEIAEEMNLSIPSNSRINISSVIIIKGFKIIKYLKLNKQDIYDVTSDIIDKIVSHINNYKWANSNKTC